MRPFLWATDVGGRGVGKGCRAIVRARETLQSCWLPVAKGATKSWTGVIRGHGSCQLSQREGLLDEIGIGLGVGEDLEVVDEATRLVKGGWNGAMARLADRVVNAS